MKELKSIYSYNNYREFIVDWLQANGYTYRQFAEQYRDFISFIALAKLLSHAKKSSRSGGEYRISPEALARLAKAMGLKADEIEYLILLRLENDSTMVAADFGDTFQKTLGTLLNDLRQQKTKKVVPKAQKVTSDYSRTSSKIAEIIDLFPERARIKLLDETILQGKIYASRQRGKPGVRHSLSLLEELAQLKDLGAP
jgi:hypothetical protein